MNKTSNTTPSMLARLTAYAVTALLALAFCMPTPALATTITKINETKEANDTSMSETYAEQSDLLFNYELDVAHAKIVVGQGSDDNAGLVLKHPDADLIEDNEDETTNYNKIHDKYLTNNGLGAQLTESNDAEWGWTWYDKDFESNGQKVGLKIGFGSLLYTGGASQGEGSGHSRPTVYMCTGTSGAQIPTNYTFDDAVTIIYENCAKTKAGVDVTLQYTYSLTVAQWYPHEWAPYKTDSSGNRIKQDYYTSGFARIMEWSRWDDKGQARLCAMSSIYEGQGIGVGQIGKGDPDFGEGEADEQSNKYGKLKNWRSRNDDTSLNGIKQMDAVNSYAQADSNGVLRRNKCHAKISIDVVFEAFLSDGKTRLTGENSGMGDTIDIPLMIDGIDTPGACYYTDSTSGKLVTGTYDPNKTAYSENVELISGWSTTAYGMKGAINSSNPSSLSEFPTTDTSVDYSCFHYTKKSGGNSLFKCVGSAHKTQSDEFEQSAARHGVMPVMTASGSSPLTAMLTWKGTSVGSKMSFANEEYQSKITVKKVDSNGKALAGAGFSVYEKSAYDKDGTKATPVFTENKTDKNGQVQFNGLELWKGYVIVETSVPAGYKKAADICIDELTYENSVEKEYTIRVTDEERTLMSVDYAHSFDDMANHLLLRPDVLTVSLLRDGAVVDTVSVSSSDNFSGSFSAEASYGENGKFYVEDENGKAYTWSINTAEVSDAVNSAYATTFPAATTTGSAATGDYAYHFSGTSDLSRTAMINVSKTWIGDAGLESSRPMLTVHLYRQVKNRDTGTITQEWKDTGQTLTLSKDTDWKGSFANLAIGYGADTYLYKVVEGVPTGYIATYSGEMKANAASTDLGIANEIIKTQLPKTGGYGLPCVLGIGAVTAIAGAALWAWSIRRRRAGEEIAEAFARRRPTAR